MHIFIVPGLNEEGRKLTNHSARKYLLQKLADEDISENKIMQVNISKYFFMLANKLYKNKFKNNNNNNKTKLFMFNIHDIHIAVTFVIIKL